MRTWISIDVTTQPQKPSDANPLFGCHCVGLCLDNGLVGLERYSTLVVKSMQHFRGAFTSLARDIIVADSGVRRTLKDSERAVRSLACGGQADFVCFAARAPLAAHVWWTPNTHNHDRKKCTAEA